METFPHLSKAPIVEAVIDIRITPKNDIDEKKLKKKLKKMLPEYPNLEKIHTKSFEISFGNIEGQTKVNDLGFVGYKLRHKTEPYIAQFYKDTFVFSRLSPYNKWVSFSKEAVRLWDIFRKIMNPDEIQRIGVRYINKIVTTEPVLELSDYYVSGPESIPKTDWPIAHFLHKDTYSPNDKYIVNVVKTIQIKQKNTNMGLILDIDVIMNKKMFVDTDKINKYLLEMKDLKNISFFNSLKPEIIKRFK